MEQYNAIICTWLATFAAKFMHFIYHQFCTLYQSANACAWLAEQFCTFHTSLHESDTQQICKIFIPKKYVTFNDKDPPQLNDHIKLLIKKKNVVLQKYLKDGRTNANYNILQASQEELNHSKNLPENEYFRLVAGKLNIPGLLINNQHFC